jgi:hypothetical protein
MILAFAGFAGVPFDPRADCVEIESFDNPLSVGRPVEKTDFIDPRMGQSQRLISSNHLDVDVDLALTRRLLSYGVQAEPRRHHAGHAV